MNHDCPLNSHRFECSHHVAASLYRPSSVKQRNSHDRGESSIQLPCWEITIKQAPHPSEFSLIVSSDSFRCRSWFYLPTFRTRVCLLPLLFPQINLTLKTGSKANAKESLRITKPACLSGWNSLKNNFLIAINPTTFIISWLTNRKLSLTAKFIIYPLDNKCG